MQSNRPTSRIIVFLLIGFIILAIGGILIYFKVYKNSQTPSVNIDRIKLFSLAKGYNLQIGNRSSLGKILEERKVFENGVYDPNTQKLVAVKNIEIILASSEQPMVATYWQTESGSINAISGNYDINDSTSTLDIDIYIVPSSLGLGNTNFRNNAFNYQLINMLIAITPTSLNPKGTNGFSTEKAIFDKYIGTDKTKYPIKII